MSIEYYKDIYQNVKSHYYSFFRKLHSFMLDTLGVLLAVKHLVLWKFIFVYGEVAEG